MPVPLAMAFGITPVGLIIRHTVAPFFIFMRPPIWRIMLCDKARGQDSMLLKLPVTQCLGQAPVLWLRDYTRLQSDTMSTIHAAVSISLRAASRQTVLCLALVAV
jgi:hypothetical protein